MGKLLIVGAGLTGSAIAHLIKRSATWNTVQVLDKGRAPGGRCTTTEYENHHENASGTVDLGAQYFSISPKNAVQFKQIYDPLKEAGILQPLTGIIDSMPTYDNGTEHWIAPKGSSSIVNQWLEGVSASYSCRVTALHRVKDSHWQVHFKRHGNETIESEEFDAVVLTCPVPQLFQLDGDISQILNEHEEKTNLLKVDYSSRFAYGLFFPTGSLPPSDCVARYVANNSCIRYISWDKKKRGENCAKQQSMESLCIHTTVPFALKHLQSSASNLQNIVLKEVENVLGYSLPQPVFVKAHKWKYSQVHHNFPIGCLSLVKEKPILIVAGDAFSDEVGINACADSAMNVAKILLRK